MYNSPPSVEGPYRTANPTGATNAPHSSPRVASEELVQLAAEEASPKPESSVAPKAKPL